MSKSTIKRSTILLFVFVVSVALIAADLVVFAQNSSNTGGDQTRGGQMTSNDNMQNTNTGGTGRRRRRRGGSANANTGGMTGDMTGTANTGDMSGNANTGMGGTGRRRRRRGNSNSSGITGAMTTTTTPVADSAQTDLSGTYTGSLSCSSVGGIGEGTLTITGNQFTWTPTAGGPAASGRVAAVTTRGYTAVAMQFGESVAPPAGGTSTPPVIISLRAKKNGDRLTLTSVANGTKDCSFTSGGGSMSGGGGRRRRRGRRSSGAGMGATTTTTDTGMTGTTDTGTTTTTGGTGRRRRRRGNSNSNGNMSNTNMSNMNR